MSSGDSETPPTYYFSGMTFNPDFYTTSTSTYITKVTGKKYFLSYPTAQGDETIDRIYTQNISSITPTENFNFLDSQTANIYIGENTTGTSGQIIQIGAPALTNTKIGDLSIIANSINNATNSGTRGVKIADAQTASGADLDLGVHANRLGDINIGTGNTSAAPNINIGAVTGSTRAGATISIGQLTTNAISIGHSTANVTISSSSGSIKTPALTTGTFSASSSITANGGITIPSGKTLTANGGIISSSINTATGGTMAIGASSTGGITIGAVNAPTTIAGLLTADGGLKLNAGDLITANGGLTLGGAYGITLTTTSYTPISTQLGYIGRAYNQNTVNYSTGTVGSDIVNTGTVLAIGIYQMMWTVSVNNWTNGTSAYMNFSFNTSGAISMYGVPQTSGLLPPTSGSDFIMQLQGVTNSNTQFATFNFSCIVKSTLASQEINLRGKINTGTNTATTPPGYGQVTWIKIA